MTRSYWQPLGPNAAADMGARVVPMQHDHEVWHMGDVTMLVRIIDGMPHALDVCGQPDGPITVPTWVAPRGTPFVAAELAAESRARIQASRDAFDDWAFAMRAYEDEQETRAMVRAERREERRRMTAEERARMG